MLLSDNVAEAKYGTQAWDEYVYSYISMLNGSLILLSSYWSKLDGDGEIVWGRSF